MNANHHSESRTEYWQQQVNTWSQTDLSGAKFCQAQGLVYHQFVYWRQKLLNPTPKKRTPQSPSGFSQVSYPSVEQLGLILSLPNDVEIRGIDASNVSVVQILLASM